MNLLGRWNPKFWRREFPAAPGGDVHFEAASASGLNDLQVRLNHWTDLWTEDKDTAAKRVVAERLGSWMDRCFGQHLQSSVQGKDSAISMASSTPIFTAFLGRRATRELSRRVLQDI